MNRTANQNAILATLDAQIRDMAARHATRNPNPACGFYTTNSGCRLAARRESVDSARTAEGIDAALGALARLVVEQTEHEIRLAGSLRA